MKNVSCLLCGSNRSNPVFHVKRDKHYKLVEDLRKFGSTLVMCADCGFAFHNPMLTPSETDILYSKLTRRVPPNEKYLQGKVKTLKSQIEWIVQFINVNGSKEKAILDIGCAEGTLLLLFKDMGWRSYGIEPCEAFSDYGKTKLGLNIETGFFTDRSFPGRKFDLVVMRAVLEHVHNPIEFLINAGKRLKDGGYLYLEVPDLKTPRDNVKNSHYQSTHLYLFTVRTIGNLLNKAGLIPVAVRRINSSIQVIGGKRDLDNSQEIAAQEIDDYKEVRRIIRRHLIRWYLRAEWKEKLKAIFASYGTSNQ